MIEYFYASFLGLFSLLSPCTFIIIPVIISDIKNKLGSLVSFLLGIVATFSILGVLAVLTGKIITNFIGGWLYFIAGAITLISALKMLDILKFHIPILVSRTPKQT